MTDPEINRCVLRAMADTLIQFHSLNNYLCESPGLFNHRHDFHIYQSEVGSKDAVYLVRVVTAAGTDSMLFSWSVRINISSECFSISAGVDFEDGGTEETHEVIALSEETTNAKHAAECIARFATEICAKVEHIKISSK